MNYIDITQPNQTLNVSLNTSESTETIVTESEELVTNSGFDTDSNWGFVGDGSISSGELILPCCIFNNRVSQNIGMSSSKSYKLEISITEITSGDTVDYLRGGTWISFGTQLGINTEYITNPNDATLFLRNNNGTSRITIDNVSVKEITEESNGVSINLSVYADGSDSLILNFDSSITSHNYYQAIEINSTELTQLKDETQYNIVGVDSNNKVIYRGKFQTTSKDILDYSINENKYTQKINSNNYTILD